MLLIARGPDPVTYVVLVQYNWRTGYWSLYVLARITGGLDPGIGIYVSDLECQKGWILEFVFMSLVLDSLSTRS